MKIAITGHSAGIGQALAKVYKSKGHEIIGLSKRNGYNIRNLRKIVPMIEPCDMFISNAQEGYAQTELLFDVYEAWRGQSGKKIIIISTQMTSFPISVIPGHDMTKYHHQKVTLEEAYKQLLNNKDWPKLILIKPGAVGTQPNQQTPYPYADVDSWAQTVVNILECAGPDMEVTELTLGVNYRDI
tara:strand:+ start:1826 stop:2380 length:555 start_codon:yes stop_codon:yes gene_type:complete